MDGTPHFEGTTRLERSKEFASREALITKRLSMDYVDDLYIDPDTIPAGMDYRWIRHTTFNDPALSNMNTMLSKGWTPVPASRHIDRMLFDDRWSVSKDHDNIIHKGLVLCERPIHYGRLEKKRCEDSQYRILHSIPGMENFMSDPSMPMKVIANTVESPNYRRQSFKED